MAEVNNNIPNFGRNIEKVDSRNNTVQKEHVIKEENDKNYVPDTGVLGRSQVKETVSSADEAVMMLKKNPHVMEASDKIFDIIYKKYIDEGLDPSQAYLNALEAQKEFVAIANKS